VLWWRWLGFGLGAVILLWLPFEEDSQLTAILLAAGLCSWAAVPLFSGSEVSDRRMILRSAVVGGLAGLLVSPTTFLLMSLKSGLHAHPQPDFMPAQILAVFSRTQYFAVSGMLLGLASALFRIARQER
jgi:hypothetical protein